MCLYHLQDKAKNLKRVYLIQTNKKQIQGHIYVNQRDDILKSEGEVTSLSGANKREVRDNREKW
jgi:hypothetical protein